MAAYAAPVSLLHIIEHIQHHPRPPISLDKEQVRSLTENITFLQDFLESCSNGGGEDANALVSRIANAAYAAEDVIESHVVDQILGRSTSHGEEINSISIDFYRDLQKVIDEMYFVKKEVTEIYKEKMEIHNQLQHINSISTGSSKTPSTWQNTMVGFDDVLIEIMDKLTAQQTNRQIMPIVGMGGIGKTTLARNIYVNPLIVQHFDILAWVTISQEYSVREILLEVLLCLEIKGSNKSLSQMGDYELGEKLYKSLSGRRYLIIIDDIWSIEAWEKVKLLFPENHNRSRIIITTRLSNVAFHLSGCHGIELSFLDENKSWELLCKSVFGEEDCPLELEEMGKEIAKNCKGLPLSIVVIGGLLAKSERTREYWEYIAENLSSIVNLEDNERCLKILHTSYNQLPIHLKPCFLYMGVFPEDHIIRVSSLVKVWVAEGFLKPISSKSLEVVAEEYLKDLIDRNLILVCEWGYTGKIKSCNMHDLLKDICLREAQKEKLICLTRPHSLTIPQELKTQRRISIQRSTRPPVLHALESASLARSLICDFQGVLPLHPFRLLRVLKELDKDLYSEHGYPLEAIFQLVNSRFLSIRTNLSRNSRFSPSIYLLWNLQTLIVKSTWDIIAPPEIWKMTQLRHVEFNALHLSDPPISSQMDGGDDDIVLGNLQTLLKIRNFKIGEDVVKRIPNIKKLQIDYIEFLEGSRYHLNNLGHLQKLESLGCSFSRSQPSRSHLLDNLIFPHSLKKLSIHGNKLHWEDMATKIGLLPLLQVLKLRMWSFMGPQWETVEGQFCSLRFLLIGGCRDLEYWSTDSTHFPRLEHLVLRGLHKLKEIPSGIGEIPTLQTIEFEGCSESSVMSAKRIREEQEELGNVGLQVRVRLWGKYQL